MGLFVRKDTPTISNYFTIGKESAKLIVGLGNVGKQYENTRHNAGFICVDYLVSEQGEAWKEKKSLKCHVAEVRMGEKRVLFIKPTTLMNLSGDAVLAVKQFYKLKNSDILVVHDELDLPYGSLRLRQGGGSAGNNGIKSVSASIGEDYARLRIGIKNKHSEKMDSAEFVLKPFSSEEQGHLKAMQTEVASLITEFVFSDQLMPDTRSFI